MPGLIGEVYRGYYLRSNLSGSIWAEKDSVLICWASSVEEAKSKIDELLEDQRCLQITGGKG